MAIHNTYIYEECVKANARQKIALDVRISNRLSLSLLYFYELCLYICLLHRKRRRRKNDSKYTSNDIL